MAITAADPMLDRFIEVILQSPIPKDTVEALKHQTLVRYAEQAQDGSPRQRLLARINLKLIMKGARRSL